jgi:hypothetical protein
MKAIVASAALLPCTGGAFGQSNCTNGSIGAVSQPFAGQCLGSPERVAASVVSNAGEPTLKVTSATATPQRSITVVPEPSFSDAGTYLFGTRAATLQLRTSVGGTITWDSLFSRTPLGMGDLFDQGICAFSAK